MNRLLGPGSLYVNRTCKQKPKQKLSSDPWPLGFQPGVSTEGLTPNTNLLSEAKLFPGRAGITKGFSSVSAPCTSGLLKGRRTQPLEGKLRGRPGQDGCWELPRLLSPMVCSPLPTQWSEPSRSTGAVRKGQNNQAWANNNTCVCACTRTRLEVHAQGTLGLAGSGHLWDTAGRSGGGVRSGVPSQGTWAIAPACFTKPQLCACKGNVGESFCFILRCRSQNVHAGGNALNRASSSGPNSKSAWKTVRATSVPYLLGRMTEKWVLSHACMPRPHTHRVASPSCLNSPALSQDADKTRPFSYGKTSSSHPDPQQPLTRETKYLYFKGSMWHVQKFSSY